MSNNTFNLYDIRVEVAQPNGKMVCNHTVGDFFEVSGENLKIPNNQTWSLYALAAILPLIPAKQRQTDQNDWMTSDDVVACPDPHCGGRFKILRLDQRLWDREKTTITKKTGGA